MSLRAWNAGVSLAAALALFGCATPEPPTSLVEAESAYRNAARDPDVSKNAPVYLYEAKKVLDGAKRTWQDDDEDPRVEHLAYVAQRRVQIARALAARRMADEQARELARERDRTVIEARSQQVDMARVEAERARKREEAATARAAELERQIEELQAKQTERGLVITLGDVLFDFNRADLKSSARHNLARLVNFLREQRDREVLVEGHTDSLGPDSYNLELSRRRAETVRIYIVDQGVASERVLSRGYGEMHPVASNASEAGRERNRRVEIVILDPGKRAAEEIWR